jgi:hypothetical protein
MNSISAQLDDCVKVTASGYIHLRILCERMEYLYGVLTVTPISNAAAADQIAACINQEAQAEFISAQRKAACVKVFANYLRARFRELSATYPAFGDERTGASFVIRKIESTLISSSEIRRYPNTNNGVRDHFVSLNNGVK